MKRGQVAIEFLTTYSYALFLLALIGSSIYLLDLGNPDRYADEECVIDSQIRCIEAQYALDDLDTDQLRLRVRNNYPRDVTIHAANVSLVDSSRMVNETGLNTPLSSGQADIINISMKSYGEGDDWGQQGYVSETVVNRVSITLGFETPSGNNYTKTGYVVFRTFEI